MKKENENESDYSSFHRMKSHPYQSVVIGWIDFHHPNQYNGGFAWIVVIQTSLYKYISLHHLMYFCVLLKKGFYHALLSWFHWWRWTLWTSSTTPGFGQPDFDRGRCPCSCHCYYSSIIHLQNYVIEIFPSICFDDCFL